MVKAKKLYHYAQNKFNSIIQENRRLNQEIKEKQSVVQDKKNDVSFKTDKLAHLCSKANQIFTANLDIHNTEKAKDMLAVGVEECVDKMSGLTVGERTRAFFKIFGTEKGGCFLLYSIEQGY